MYLIFFVSLNESSVRPSATSLVKKQNSERKSTRKHGKQGLTLGSKSLNNLRSINVTMEESLSQKLSVLKDDFENKTKEMKNTKIKKMDISNINNDSKYIKSNNEDDAFYKSMKGKAVKVQNV